MLSCIPISVPYELSEWRPVCIPSLSFQKRALGNYVQECCQINRDSETKDLALGHWNYDFWTKRKVMAAQPAGRSRIKRIH